MRIAYLHGMGGSAADWAEVQALLPGEALRLPSGGTVGETIGALLAQIEEPASTVLCGYSMGGRLALLLADELLRRKNPPRGLALLGAGLGFPDEESRRERRKIDEDWARLAESDAPQFWAEWYRQTLFASFMDLPKSRQTFWLKSRMSMDIKTLTAQLRNLGPARHEALAPVLDRLKKASISVLYLAGELDKKYLTLGQKLAKETGVALAVIPRAGHVLPLEAPGEVAERLKQFFSSAQQETHHGKKH